MRQPAHRSRSTEWLLHNVIDWMKRCPRIVTALAVFALLCAAVLILTEFERGVRYEYNRTMGFRKIYSRVVKNAGVLGTGVCFCLPDKESRLRLQSGFEIAISIYDRGGPSPRPGIVLIHGNTWLGRNLSLYRLLADRLAREGYIVLTYDKVGFGESDDPFGQGPSTVAAAYDRVGQVDEVVQYLIENTLVDHNNITVIGHSGGVDQALEIGMVGEDIANIVIMPAPPSPPSNGSSQPDKSAYFTRRFRARYRFIYGKDVPNWFTWELTGVEARDPDYYLKHFRASGHKPLMVVLGERDQPAGHTYVLRIFDQMVEPKKLALIRRSDHYANTAQSLWLVFYDRAVARQLVSELVAWLATNRSGGTSDLEDGTGGCPSSVPSC